MLEVVYTCVYWCRSWMHRDQRLTLDFLSTIFNFMFYFKRLFYFNFFRRTLFQNPELTVLTYWLSSEPLWLACLWLSLMGDTGTCSHPQLLCGCWKAKLLLVQKALYQLSCLPTIILNYFLIKILNLCVYVSVSHLWTSSHGDQMLDPLDLELH